MTSYYQYENGGLRCFAGTDNPATRIMVALPLQVTENLDSGFVDITTQVEVNHNPSETVTMRRVYQPTVPTAILRYTNGDEMTEYPLRLVSERHEDGEAVQTWEIVEVVK